VPDAAAAAKLASDQYDLLISDLDMPWQAFLKLTLQNVMAALVDLKMFTEAFVRQQDPQMARQLLDSSRPLLLMDALRETITVLEKSRGAFKSKELGDLRKKLENLI